MITIIAVTISIVLLFLWIVVPMISSRRAIRRAREADVKAYRATVHKEHSESSMEQERLQHKQRMAFRKANREKRLEQLNQVANKIKRRRK